MQEKNQRADYKMKAINCKIKIHRKFQLALSVAAHFYFFLFYRTVFRSKIVYPTVLYTISRWPSLVHLYMQDEHQFAFQLLNHLAQMHHLENKSIEVSVVMFWLSIDAAIIRFSIQSQDRRAPGHAWFELNGQIYTVAVDDTKWPMHSLKKQDAHLR